MDQINKIVDVVITKQTSTPSMASFSEHLIVDAFDATGFPESDKFDADHRVRSYESLSELVSAGFPTTGFVYRAAKAQLAQSPHISRFYVGWKDTSESWETALNAILAENQEWYALTVSSRRLDEQKTIASWVQSNEKLAILATGDSNVITTATGDIADYLKTQNIDRVAVVYHPDCNDETVYTVYSEDGVNFYSDPELETPAVIPDGVTPVREGTTEIYHYSVYGLNPNDPIPEAAWFGLMLTKHPGSANWALKTLIGVPVCDLSSAQSNAAEGKRANVYVSAAGVAITKYGYTGNGWIDETQGLDWVKARIQNAVFAVLANNDKIPYTDAGVQMIVSPLKQALEEAVKWDILSEYDVTYPAVADVSITNKGNRHLPDVKFTGTLSGAINTVKINGVVTL